MKRLKQMMQNNEFVPFCLLYGDEDYLKRTYFARLKQAMVGEDDMNYSYFEGKDVRYAQIKDLSETMPFFAERRLIVLENSGAFKNASEELVEILNHAPETTFFLFVESEVDKRNRVFKLVNEKGYACELKTLSGKELGVWLAKLLSDAGKKITNQDMEYFLAKGGQDADMFGLSHELEKLIGYMGEREVVTTADIDAICTTQTSDRVFDMLDAIAAGNKDQAMALYADLLNLKESPLKILVLLGRQFFNLLGVRQLMDQELSNQEVIARMKLRPFLIGKMTSQASKFSYEELTQAVADCVEADASIKQGRLDEKYAVELVILKYCNRENMRK